MMFLWLLAYLSFSVYLYTHNTFIIYGLIKGFGNFKDDKSVTYDAIGKALYAPFDENGSRYIYDTFAKYALEEVANRFQDWWYEQDESEFD